jgi:hypothetical protein
MKLGEIRTRLACRTEMNPNVRAIVFLVGFALTVYALVGLLT